MMKRYGKEFKSNVIMYPIRRVIKCTIHPAIVMMLVVAGENIFLNCFPIHSLYSGVDSHIGRFGQIIVKLP